MATHSSILAWEIPWTEEPGGLQSKGSQRVGHDLLTKPPAPKLGETVRGNSQWNIWELSARSLQFFCILK